MPKWRFVPRDLLSLFGICLGQPSAGLLVAVIWTFVCYSDSLRTHSFIHSEFCGPRLMLFIASWTCPFPSTIPLNWPKCQKFFQHALTVNKKNSSSLSIVPLFICPVIFFFLRCFAWLRPSYRWSCDQDKNAH